MVICLERCADLHMAQLIPLPLTDSCFSKMQIGFTFLVLAHLGSPGQMAVKRVCVCVWHVLAMACVCLCLCLSQVSLLLKGMNGLIWFWYEGFFRRIYCDRSFAVSGPVAWNSLPVALRSSDVTEETNRRHLKTLLFNYLDN